MSTPASCVFYSQNVSNVLSASSQAADKTERLRMEGDLPAAAGNFCFRKTLTCRHPFDCYMRIAATLPAACDEIGKERETSWEWKTRHGCVDSRPKPACLQTRARAPSAWPNKTGKNRVADRKTPVNIRSYIFHTAPWRNHFLTRRNR